MHEIGISMIDITKSQTSVVNGPLCTATCYQLQCIAYIIDEKEGGMTNE